MSFKHQFLVIDLLRLLQSCHHLKLHLRLQLHRTASFSLHSQVLMVWRFLSPLFPFVLTPTTFCPRHPSFPPLPLPLPPLTAATTKPHSCSTSFIVPVLEQGCAFFVPCRIIVLILFPLSSCTSSSLPLLPDLRLLALPPPSCVPHIIIIALTVF